MQSLSLAFWNVYGLLIWNVKETLYNSDDAVTLLLGVVH